jgi:hypothetical protein
VLIDHTFSRFKFVYPVLIFGLIVANIYLYIDVVNPGGDTDYSHSIQLDQQVVSYCEQQNLQDKNIFTPTVLRIDFAEPVAGYLSGKPFTKLDWAVFYNTEYCIFSSDDYNSVTHDEIMSGHKLQLMQRFEKKNAWREIYKIVK